MGYGGAEVSILFEIHLAQKVFDDWINFIHLALSLIIKKVYGRRVDFKRHFFVSLALNGQVLYRITTCRLTGTKS